MQKFLVTETIIIVISVVLGCWYEVAVCYMCFLVHDSTLKMNWLLKCNYPSEYASSAFHTNATKTLQYLFCVLIYLWKRDGRKNFAFHSGEEKNEGAHKHTTAACITSNNTLLSVQTWWFTSAFFSWFFSSVEQVRDIGEERRNNWERRVRSKQMHILDDTLAIA